MKFGRYIIILGAVALSACSSNTVKDTLGLNTSAPDEFRVVSRPPLSIPPQFTLRPPDNSDAPVGQISASQQAKALVLGGKPADGSTDVNTAITPVKVIDKPAPKAKADKTSGAEEQFLKNAGADKADPKVRDAIVEDQYAKQEKHDECSWWNVTCSAPDAKDPLVDAKKESDRIKTDTDNNQPVTTGDTAVVKDRDTGLLGKILGISMAIRILPPTLVNRIAAGEVIERPASVVKELVENAIDAGATRIDISVEQAGKNRIAIQDNGKGMSRDELALAVQRHATSKLPSDDLLDIRYLGFRGEALPSVGSISRLTVTSRTAGSDNAWSLYVEGGNIGEIQPAVLTQGTLVEVCDLFYATPARLKFLKSDRTEIQQALDIVNRLAMVHPGIAFSFSSDGKSMFRVDAQGDLLDASLKRLAQIMGKEFTDNALALDTQRETLRLTGFAALPTFNRGTSAEQYLFVNRRPVRDKLLLGSIRGAYQDVLAHDRHAVVVLFLEVPAEEVDVNVHPAKAEVRFRDSNAMRGLMVGAIKHALSDAGFRASTMVANQALQSFSGGNNSYRSPSYDYLGQAKASFHEGVKQFFEPLVGFGNATASLMSQDMLEPMARPAETSPDDSDYTLYPLGAARCQIHKTYIVAETVDGLVIVDQHAAHERLVYESMKKGLAERGIASQKLLLPEIVELDPALCESMLARSQELHEFGLAIESFGAGSIVVRETPAMLGEVNVGAMVQELADNIREFGEVLSLKERIEELCGTMACYSSVRAGRSLAVAEMNALLRQMEQTPFSGQCNHGRPTYIELKRKDIERLFGRT